MYSIYVYPLRGILLNSTRKGVLGTQLKTGFHAVEMREPHSVEMRWRRPGDNPREFCVPRQLVQARKCGCTTHWCGQVKREMRSAASPLKYICGCYLWPGNPSYLYAIDYPLTAIYLSSSSGRGLYLLVSFSSART
jgi:hypothetical protein